MATSWLKARSSLLSKLLGAGAATALSIRLLCSESFARDRDQVGDVKDKKLVSVVMLTRHGARTPLYLISGLEEAEYKKEWIEPYVKATYRLQSLDGQDFEDHMSLYDLRNYDRKLKVF